MSGIGKRNNSKDYRAVNSDSSSSRPPPALPPSLSHSSSTSSSTSSSSSAFSSSSTSLSSDPSSSESSSYLRPHHINNNSFKSRIKMAISPRSANYEFLEGGMGPSRNPLPLQRRLAAAGWTWKKMALAALVVVGVFWVFGPTTSSSSKTGYPSTTSGENNLGVIPEDSTLPTYTHENTTPDTKPINDSGSGSDKPTKPNKPAHPTSFSSDPNPALTTHCISPYTPGSPLISYTLIIDAGSTGSRIHVYKFNHCFSSPTYEYEVFKQTQPGLSSYASTPDKAAESLDVLLEDAVKVVPESLRKCSPVAVRATAGLRLLPGGQADAILKAVEERLKGRWPFPLAGEGEKGVSVMDGKDEGVYAWITSNYLLGTLGGDAQSTSGSYAVLDLGGASTQIAFQPTTKDLLDKVTGDYKFELNFAEKKHVLYQHSYLGYGLMSTRKRTHELIYFMDNSRKDSTQGQGDIPNPCLAQGSLRKVALDSANVTMSGADVGSFEACSRVMQLVLAKDAVCTQKPCSFDGVYQPSLNDTFPSGPVLLLSYFYDRLYPLLSISTPTSTTSTTTTSTSTDPDTLSLPISTISTLAQTVCSGRPAWLSSYGTHPDLMEELHDRPEYCLDLTYMYMILTGGYGFERGREVKIGKKIDGTELGWALGAGLEVVGGERRCTA